MTEFPQKIALGCGNEKPEEFLGVDINETEAVDVVQDLDKEWEKLPSNHFTDIIAHNIFEHLDNPINFIEELYRIAQDGANIEVIGPHLSSMNWHDPTHKRLMGTKTFDNFSNSADYEFYSNANFSINEIEILFSTFRKQPHKFIAYPIANEFPKLYENTFISRLLPAQDIKFIMEAKK